MPTMNRRQSMTLFALLPVALGVSAFVAMAAKDQSYVPSPDYVPSGVPSRQAAVVYYSRSGHSEAVAREIARLFNAPIARITADYPLSFSGQGKALTDAGRSALPPIEVEPIELQHVERVYLVSPIWLFRPATPLWAYVEQTDLTPVIDSSVPNADVGPCRGYVSDAAVLWASHSTDACIGFEQTVPLLDALAQAVRCLLYTSPSPRDCS